MDVKSCHLIFNFLSLIKFLNGELKNLKNIKPLEVVESFNPETITFNTVDEFNKYYALNEEEFMTLSTYKLNLKYKIPGYKITKPKDKDGKVTVKLITDYVARKIKNEEMKEGGNERINKIEEELKELSEAVSKLYMVINEMTNNKL